MVIPVASNDLTMMAPPNGRSLASNQLTGTVPHNWPSSLRRLYVSAVRCQERLCLGMSRLSQRLAPIAMTVRRLDDNELNGTLPSSLVDLGRLEWLYVL